MSTTEYQVKMDIYTRMIRWNALPAGQGGVLVSGPNGRLDCQEGRRREERI